MLTGSRNDSSRRLIFLRAGESKKREANTANGKAATTVAIDQIVEAATHGVLRALEARKLGSANVEDLVRSGFGVQIVIRAGGWPPFPELNPQPLPPRRE